MEIGERTECCHSLLYVSRCRVTPAADPAQIAQIVRDAAAFNAANGVTGALITTRNYFAQHLEGPQAVIAALMRRIETDPRHSDVRIIREAPGVARLFGQWSMAYCGPTGFLDREIGPALAASPRTDEHARHLLALMLEFVRQDRLDIP